MRRIALGEPVDLQDVRKVDAGLGGSLARLQAAHHAWQRAGKHLTPLFIDGAPIEDLCLTFVLPGMPLHCALRDSPMQQSRPVLLAQTTAMSVLLALMQCDQQLPALSVKLFEAVERMLNCTLPVTHVPSLDMFYLG